MGREEVLADEDQAWADLREACVAVPEERRGVEGVVPGWSTHDTLWHVAYWVGRVAIVLEDATQGTPYPEEPEEESFYDAENVKAFDTGREMSWNEIIDHFETGRARARAAVAGCDDEDEAWLSERLEEEVEHYREHASEIRRFAASEVLKEEENS